jgi:hypothetical protein
MSESLVSSVRNWRAKASSGTFLNIVQIGRIQFDNIWLCADVRPLNLSVAGFCWKRRVTILDAEDGDANER